MKTNEKKAGITPFGKAVKKKAIDKGMALSHVAKEAGTSSSYLNQIMYGKRTGEKYVRRIAEILGIDISRYIAS